MNHRITTLTTAIALGATLAPGSPITYQGELLDNGERATGLYDMRFYIGDSEVLGIFLQFIDIDDVEVENGRFQVELDFNDSIFTGEDRWLQINVEGEALMPRQMITYTPYSIRANIANDLEVPWVVVSDLDIVDATSLRGTPLRGYAMTPTLNNPGVLGETDSRGSEAAGVLGRANSRSDTSPAFGVRGITQGTGFLGAGVQGIHEGNGIGVQGISEGIGAGVSGNTDFGIGVLGVTPNGTGVFGTSTNGIGVRASTSTDVGVSATTGTGSAAIYGLHGTSDTEFFAGTPDHGAEAYNTEIDGEGTALYAEGGRVGISAFARGEGFGSDLTRIGVEGRAGDFSSGANMFYGVRGFAQNPVEGGARTAYGIYGGAQVGNGTNTAYGVFGETFGPGGTQFAGYFQGDVHVAGTLSKSSGTFKIDHPLDPENMTLSHSFVESPEMLNVYSGVVTLDEIGGANIELPRYFETLNTDFRYQLTPIGAPMPTLFVSNEVVGNTFRIDGGEPGMRVSWEVSGVRQDPSALHRPVIVEQLKAPEQRGRYLDPDAYGLDRSRAIHHPRRTKD